MDAVSFFVALLVLINPFALFVYLNPIIEEVGRKVFVRHVLLYASIISFAILTVFVLSGTAIFDRVLGIHFGAFRIFGGIVLLTIALIFITQGGGSMIALRGSLTSLASEIALPYMVGAGTISMSVLAGEALPTAVSMLVLTLAIVINYLTVLLLMWIKYRLLSDSIQAGFDNMMEVFLRINGFFVGAFGVNLVVEGIQQVFLGLEAAS